MATRCNIIAKDQTSDLWCAIYCHYDGYETHTGRILKADYTDPAKVQELILLGDISVLKESVEATTAYHRDRDENFEDTRPVTGSDLLRLVHHVYDRADSWCYVFDGEKWWTNPSDRELVVIMQNPIPSKEAPEVEEKTYTLDQIFKMLTRQPFAKWYGPDGDFTAWFAADDGHGSCEKVKQQLQDLLH